METRCALVRMAIESLLHSMKLMPYLPTLPPGHLWQRSSVTDKQSSSQFSAPTADSWRRGRRTALLVFGLARLANRSLIPYHISLEFCAHNSARMARGWPPVMHLEMCKFG